MCARRPILAALFAARVGDVILFPHGHSCRKCFPPTTAVRLGLLWSQAAAHHTPGCALFCGGMCEWLKQAVLKTALPLRATGVRIPLPPP